MSEDDTKKEEETSASDPSTEENKALELGSEEEKSEEPKEEEEKDYKALYEEKKKQADDLTIALRKEREKKEDVKAPTLTATETAKKEKPPADYFVKVAERDFTKTWTESFDKFKEKHPELKDKDLFEKFKEEASMRGKFLMDKVKGDPDAIVTGNEVIETFAKALKTVSPDKPKENLERDSYIESQANLGGMAGTPTSSDAPLTPSERKAAQKAGLTEKEYQEFKGEGEMVIE